MKTILGKDLLAKDGDYQIIEIRDDAKEFILGDEKIIIDTEFEELDPTILTHQCRFAIGDTEEQTDNSIYLEFPSVKFIFELLPSNFGGIDKEEFIEQQKAVLDDEIVVAQNSLRELIDSAIDSIYGAKSMVLN